LTFLGPDLAFQATVTASFQGDTILTFIHDGDNVLTVGGKMNTRIKIILLVFGCILVIGLLVYGGFVRYKNPEYVIKRYDRAIELNPEDVDAWLSRAKPLVKLKGYEEVLKSYDRALELDPKNVNAWVNRGSLLLMLNRYEEAQNI
jgi:tetratricopeptide (TPR) repeat protein